MSIFNNYENLQTDYVPNNQTTNCPAIPPIDKLGRGRKNLPYEIKNELGNVVGYQWYYGDTVKLIFDVYGELTVESSSIIYTMINEAPSSTTVGFVGQRAYNVTDLKSWTCNAVSSDTYFWEQDDIFHYPEEGNPVYVNEEDYLRNKEFQLCIYNFRGEVIYSNVFSAAKQLVFIIDEAMSSTMSRGNYSLSLSLVSPDKVTETTLISKQDCVLTVR